MYIQPWLRLSAAAPLCLCLTIAAAQEPPIETPDPVPVEAAPPAEPAPAADPAPKPDTRPLVLLPVEFIVYQQSVAGVEAMPDWTEAARFALGDAAMQLLREIGRFEIVPLPELARDAKDLLREHVELFKLIANNVSAMKAIGGKAWRGKWDDFDYALGDGLQFLTEASGADYAFILGGSQVAQTGGQAVMQFLVGGAGGGTFIAAAIIDLRDGRIRWFNYREGTQVFGITGSDVRNPATAAEMVASMFVGFPEVKVVTLPPF